jgi:hypothetical protein
MAAPRRFVNGIREKWAFLFANFLTLIQREINRKRSASIYHSVSQLFPSRGMNAMLNVMFSYS